MTRRIGVAVASDEIRGVVLDDLRPRWSMVQERNGDESLQASLVTFLGRVPRGRRKPRVDIAIGPSAAQVKRLEGLPALTDARLREAMVKESINRLFLRNGTRLVAAMPYTMSPDEVWGAAFDGHVIDAVTAAAGETGMRVGAIVPAVSVVGYGLVDRVVIWPDGDTHAVLEYLESQLISAKRCSGPAALTPLEPVPQLAELGAEAWRFADAYGVAAVNPNDPSLLRVRTDKADPASAFGIWMPAISLIGALIWSGLAPGLRASLEARRHADALEALYEPNNRAVQVVANLAQFGKALDEVAALSPPGGPRTTFFHVLTGALPDSIAIASVRLDSSGGTLTLLGQQATAAVGPLERLAPITSLELVGPVTHEQIAGIDHQRLMLRFRWTGTQ